MERTERMERIALRISKALLAATFVMTATLAGYVGTGLADGSAIDPCLREAAIYCERGFSCHHGMALDSFKLMSGPDVQSCIEHYARNNCGANPVLAVIQDYPTCEQYATRDSIADNDFAVFVATLQPVQDFWASEPLMLAIQLDE